MAQDWIDLEKHFTDKGAGWLSQLSVLVCLSITTFKSPIFLSKERCQKNKVTDYFSFVNLEINRFVSWRLHIVGLLTSNYIFCSDVIIFNI